MALYTSSMLREMDSIDFDASFGSSENTIIACKMNPAVSSQRSEDSFTFSEDDFDVISAAERSKRPLSQISNTHSTAFLSPHKRSAPATRHIDLDMARKLKTPTMSPVPMPSTAPLLLNKQLNALALRFDLNSLSNSEMTSTQLHIDRKAQSNSQLDPVFPTFHPDAKAKLDHTNASVASISPRHKLSSLPLRMPGSTGLTSPSKGRNSFIPPRPILKHKIEAVVPTLPIKSEVPSVGDFASRIPSYTFRTFEPPKLALNSISGHPESNRLQDSSETDSASPTKAASTCLKDLSRFAFLPPPLVKSEPCDGSSFSNTNFGSIQSSNAHATIPELVDAVNSSRPTPGFVAPANLKSFKSLFDSSAAASKMQNSVLARLYTTSASKPSRKPQDPYPSIQLATQKPESTMLQDPNPLKKVKPIILSAEQEYVLRQALDGTSLFFTGSAGTGKSVLLRQIIKGLKAKHSEVAVTASTGLAACNIGGITLHSFAGVGLAKEKVETLMKKLRRNRKAYVRWHTTKVLVIDEVSMVDGEFLNKLDAIGRQVRKNERPFGGIQVIMCGDFYQLPPVVKNTASDGSSLSQIPEAFFAFESQAWKSCVSQTIILEEVFRQKGDQVFIDMLNELRNGSVSDVTAHNFAALLRPLNCPQGIVPAELFATRLEVDRANNTRLNQIKGPANVYTSIDTGTLPQPQLVNVLANFLAAQKLFLKVGAQVMCIKNYDETLVNGSLGQVIDFVDKNTYMKGLEADGVLPDEKMCTSDYVFDKKDKRTKSKADKPKAPGLLALAKAKETSESRKEALGEDIKNDTTNKLHPLVKFLLPDGVNSRTVLVEPEQWTVEDEKQVVLASRVQLPLILAWSLSIHKSQGQTLPKVKVDLKNVFETGQSYVALSRAVSRAGLQVLNFNASRVRSHPRVKEFYRTLEPAAQAMKKPRGQIKLSFARG